MPLAQWPYHETYEKIYICKEICEAVDKACEDTWLDKKFGKIRCADFISVSKDTTVDPKWTMTAHDRREAGGHACSAVMMSEKFRAGVGQVLPWCLPLTSLLAMLVILWSRS